MMLQGAVLVVRLPNWLGDTVMALPALAGLRAARSEALIVAVGPWAPLLTGQAVADALVRYPRDAGGRQRLARALRAMRPDAAVLLPNSFESALAAWRWGAHVRLGYDTDARTPLLSYAVPQVSPRAHQVDEYTRLLEAVGIPSPRDFLRWRLGTDAEAEALVAGLLQEAGCRGAAGLVGLHLGAAFGSSKLWPPASFAELAGRLSRAGLEPVLLGSAADAEVAARVAAAAASPIPSLVGRDRPELLPRLLSHLSCLVSGDTGVAHLAAAIGTPTVTLFGPTDPRLTAPRGRTARTVEGRAPCAPCFLRRCPIDHPCMRGIGPASVADAVLGVRAA